MRRVGLVLVGVVVMGALAVAQPAAPRPFGDVRVRDAVRADAVRDPDGAFILGGNRSAKVDAATKALDASADLPEDARKLLETYKEDAATIRKKAEQEIQERGKALAKTLKTLQDQYTRDAKLDEAVAIRDLIRKLTSSHLPIQPNPGNLSSYRENINDTFYFEVTGRTTGSVWGTEIYTYDSDLATAAVHLGLLKDGETGIIEATIIQSPEQHRGSLQNGVSSSSWSAYPASYIIRKWTGQPHAK